MSTGFNGTPMPSFVDSLTPEQRWAITDYIVSLSGGDGPGYTNLVIAKPVQERIDLSEGGRELRGRAGRALPDHRADHGARTRVPSAGDQRRPCRRSTTPSRSPLLVRWHDMSAQKTGKNGPTLPVPPEEEEEPASAQPRATARRRIRSATQRSRRTPRRRRRRIRLPRNRRQATSRRSSPTRSRSRFRRGADRRPQAVLHLRRRPELRWISGSSIWPSRDPLQFTGKGSAEHRAEASWRISPASRATTRANGRSSSSVRSRRPSAAPFSPGEFMPIAFSVWDGFARERGNRRGLTLWYSLYVEPAERPVGCRPDGEDRARHARHRAGRDRLGAVALRVRRPRRARRSQQPRRA